LRLITIPENLDVLPDGLVPICIEDYDSEGRPVNLEWIERGVRPIHRALCNLVTCVIGDVWAVSEIVTNSVHSLSRRYGHNLGTQPHAQVYVRTRWEAKNAAAGGRRLRLGLDQSLHELDIELQNACLVDSRDYAGAYEARLDVDALASTDELRLIIALHLDGWTWEEIGRQLHRKSNSAEKRFHRWRRRLRETSSNAKPWNRNVY
jgi:DNA-directed RNA polymerase specialized sigma24 family protein